ncbi:MAG: hypothetical protein GPI95_17715 [Microcystis aeruginosa LG13-11]|nr:hypothetical protein [Microcystis aeruginosa LG13-11]
MSITPLQVITRAWVSVKGRLQLYTFLNKTDNSYLNGEVQSFRFREPIAGRRYQIWVTLALDGKGYILRK